MIPTGNKILVKKLKQEKKQSLVIVPDNSDERFSEAEILEIGRGYFSQSGQWVPTLLCKGQTVLISKNAGIYLKTENNEELFLLREEEVLAILDKINGD